MHSGTSTTLRLARHVADFLRLARHVADSVSHTLTPLNTVYKWSSYFDELLATLAFFHLRLGLLVAGGSKRKPYVPVAVRVRLEGAPAVLLPNSTKGVDEIYAPTVCQKHQQGLR